MSELERTIGVSFSDQGLLLQAMTHRSYLNEHRRESVRHNERLEFLGDAVLELAVTTYLYKVLPDEEEGRMTNLRSALVNGRALAATGKRLGLERHLRMSQGERKAFVEGERSVDYITANAVEAIIGAVFLDRGYGAAELLIHEFLLPLFKKIRNADILDPKSALQEIVQEHRRIIPSYHTIAEDGPDHDKQFRVAVRFRDQQIAIGVGPSKKLAHEDAARLALKVEYDIEVTPVEQLEQAAQDPAPE